MDQNALAVRKEHAQAVLAKATVFVMVDEDVEERASVFVNRGVEPMDAVHVALAETAGVDCFCSCDDRLLRKLRRMKDVHIKLASPLELIEELES